MLLSIKSVSVFSQVKVNVKCSGTITEREYKTYDECDCNSWVIQYYENGVKSGQEWGKTRSRTIEIADHWCESWTKWDGNNYTHDAPYCDDSKLCGTVPKTIEEFRLALRNLYSSWQLELTEQIARHLGYKGLLTPSVGKLLNEYKNELDKSVDKCRQLEVFNSDFASKNMDVMVAELNNSQNDYNSFRAASIAFNNEISTSQQDNSWQILPDGTSYRILQNGMYEFFDGIDQMETVSAAEGKQGILKHQGTNRNNQNSINSKEDNGDISGLKDLYNQLVKQLNDLRQSGDADPALIKENEELLENLKRQIEDLGKEK